MITTFHRSLAFFLALLIGVVSSAHAQTGAETETQNEIVPPEAIYKVDPVHPAELFKAAVEGEAVIIALVDPFGSVLEPEIERATHEEFGLAALLAASEWIFEPATKNGVPIAIKVSIPFTFNVSFEHKLNIEIGREVFRRIDEPVTPSYELSKAPLPTSVPAFAAFYPKEFKGTGKSAAVSVEFIIDPEGFVINPRIISISTPGFETAALRAASQMKYNPIRVDGVPAYVSVNMPIHFSP